MKRQTETCAILSYLKKSYLKTIYHYTHLGKYTSEKLVTDQLAHTNRAGLKQSNFKS